MIYTHVLNRGGLGVKKPRRHAVNKPLRLTSLIQDSQVKRPVLCNKEALEVILDRYVQFTLGGSLDESCLHITDRSWRQVGCSLPLASASFLINSFLGTGKSISAGEFDLAARRYLAAGRVFAGVLVHGCVFKRCVRGRHLGAPMSR